MKTLIIGSALVDIILDVPHLPGRGTDLTCLRERTVIGGCGYNIASVFSYMEVECDLLFPVGEGTNAVKIDQAFLSVGFRALFERFSTGFTVNFSRRTATPCRRKNSI